MAESVRQLVFICGGKGTRLRGNAGTALPKSLTRVDGDPIVTRLVKQPLHL